ncbi:MAG: ECF transporter S component [Clostridiales bacterium]|nr:ECF transporter S component [Clostridiales bacterium]
MKNESSIRDIIISALMIALGILLPMAFHAFGLGSTFLPMHIPVLIAGYLLPVHFSIIVGAVTPFLSSILTGMPPFFPIMPYMCFELAAYGAAVSFIRKRLFAEKPMANVYISLIGSMIFGRIVAGLIVWILVLFFSAKLPGPVAFITGAVASGLPGIIIQLVLIPPLMVLLRKARVINQ